MGVPLGRRGTLPPEAAVALALKVTVAGIPLDAGPVDSGRSWAVGILPPMMGCTVSGRSCTGAPGRSKMKKLSVD